MASFALRRNNRVLTYPTAATALAVSAEGSQEAIDHLDGTEHHLDQSDDQQDGEEGQIPGDHILGLCALVPQGLVVKIITAGDRDTGRREMFIKCVWSPRLESCRYHFSCARHTLYDEVPHNISKKIPNTSPQSTSSMQVAVLDTWHLCLLIPHRNPGLFTEVWRLYVACSSHKLLSDRAVFVGQTSTHTVIRKQEMK